MTNNLHPLQNWIPYKTILNSEEVLCQWLYTFNKKYDEPFFDETILKCKKHVYNSSPYKSISTLNGLKEMADAIDSIPPTAFIFHISRCGSTIISQLLGLKNTISLAEVPLFDEILRIPFKHPAVEPDEIEQALAAAIKLMGQKRSKTDSALFIKVDSWHLFFFDTYRKLYPNIPFVILVRNPEEVIDSHRKLRGMQAVPGVIEPQILNIELNDILYNDLDEYTTLVLENYFDQICHILNKDQNTFLLPYSKNAMEMVATFSNISGINFTPDQLEAMKIRSSYNAKFPQNIFNEENTKQTISKHLKIVTEKYKSLIFQNRNPIVTTNN